MGDDHMPDTQGIAGAHHGGHQPVDLHHIGPDRAKDLAKQIDARGAQLCVLVLKRLARQRQANRPHVDSIPRAGLQQWRVRIAIQIHGLQHRHAMPPRGQPGCQILRIALAATNLPGKRAGRDDQNIAQRGRSSFRGCQGFAFNSANAER